MRIAEGEVLEALQGDVDGDADQASAEAHGDDDRGQAQQPAALLAHSVDAHGRPINDGHGTKEVLT
ncbi:hypothetical protein SAT01_14280 [Sinomonas atrocyanea]|nr:hypothetical protein SAT01_14280 [Sinomonas atrocyanea]GGG81940.1 hypothetical protein GCM10007172_39320 [Sinomonas atrocyanea]